MEALIVKKGMLALLFVLWAGIAAAQGGVAINPTKVGFDPSADHNELSIDGSQMVQWYELRIYLDPAGSPVGVFNLGKPTPINGRIELTNPVWFIGLTPKTKYVARVVAVGASGEGVSEVSNPFGLVPAPRSPIGLTIGK